MNNRATLRRVRGKVKKDDSRSYAFDDTFLIFTGPIDVERQACSTMQPDAAKSANIESFCVVKGVGEKLSSKLYNSRAISRRVIITNASRAAVADPRSNCR